MTKDIVMRVHVSKDKFALVRYYVFTGQIQKCRKGNWMTANHKHQQLFKAMCLINGVELPLPEVLHNIPL